MLGPTRRKVIYQRCGEMVRDRREVNQDDQILCIPCARGAYFSKAKEINWPDMNWTPGKGKQPSVVNAEAEI